MWPAPTTSTAASRSLTRNPLCHLMFAVKYLQICSHGNRGFKVTLTVSLKCAFLLIRIHVNIKCYEPDQRLKRFGYFNCLRKEMKTGFRSLDVHRSLHPGDARRCLPSVRSTPLVNFGSACLGTHCRPSAPRQSHSCLCFALPNLNNLFDSLATLVETWRPLAVLPAPRGPWLSP